MNLNSYTGDFFFHFEFINNVILLLHFNIPPGLLYILRKRWAGKILLLLLIAPSVIVPGQIAKITASGLCNLPKMKNSMKAANDNIGKK